MIVREELLALAREAAQRAFCPYSHFHVGAAVAAGEKTYTGVNIEINGSASIKAEGTQINIEAGGINTIKGSLVKIN